MIDKAKLRENINAPCFGQRSEANIVRALLDAAQREPVVIQKQRRHVAVVLSMRDYHRLTSVNVADFQEYCDRISEHARERGLTEDQRSAEVSSNACCALPNG